jgi:hypothetical protein
MSKARYIAPALLYRVVALICPAIWGFNDHFSVWIIDREGRCALGSRMLQGMNQRGEFFGPVVSFSLEDESFIFGEAIDFERHGEMRGNT